MPQFNSAGTYTTTAVKDLVAFDKLPKSLRQALADSLFDWAAQPYLTRCRRGENVDDIINGIKSADFSDAQEDRWKVWRIPEFKPPKKPRRRTKRP